MRKPTICICKKKTQISCAVTGRFVSDLVGNPQAQFSRIAAQMILDLIITMERKQWLLEHGLSANIIPVFDEYISPSNLALVAIKWTLILMVLLRIHKAI